MLRSNRICAVLYTAVVFVSGLVAGLVIQNMRQGASVDTRVSPAAAIGSDPRADKGHYIELFQKELNLTDAQTAQLEKILDQTMRQYSDLQSFTRTIRQEGITRIRAILTEDQRRRFNELLKSQPRRERKAPPAPSAPK